MADFMTNLWSAVFEAGPTPTLLIATNATFAALQVVLFALLLATYSIHFVVLSLLSAGLWFSINWFSTEIQAVQEAERQRNQSDISADSDSKVITGSDELETASPARYTGTADTATTASGVQLIDGESHHRSTQHGDITTETSTDSEWEQVDP